ncbi:ATP-binding protein [Marinobacterium rhizophilum]|uniref:histidine kinase n=1 Tax=Marinobacterium rhizophilum TaxID=420402 RepID=A0ABY5HCR9_9GAMM|nr:ATP-binding protein [Marinobacterium rhizophilum]UTW10075.1 response regulator [Marinobacterium rhizophilum]
MIITQNEAEKAFVPEPAPSTPDRTAAVKKALLLLLSYFLLAGLGMALGTAPVYAAPVWPAAGVALFGLLLWGARYWPAVFIAAWGSDLAHKLFVTGTDVSPDTVLMTAITAIGSTLQALLGAKWLQPLSSGYAAVEDESKVFYRLMLAGPVACLVAASLGNLAMYQLQAVPLHLLGASWLTWWAADSIGVLLMVPLLLLFMPLAGKAHRPHIGLLLVLPLIVAVLLGAGLLLVERAEKSDHAKSVSLASEHLHEVAEYHLLLTDKTVRVAEDYMISDLEIMTQKKFSDFFGKSVDGALLKKLVWIPRVLQTDRETFEADARERGWGDYRIYEFDGQGRAIRAAEKEAYYPVLFVRAAGQAGDLPAQAAGFDNASDADTLARMTSAIASGRSFLIERHATFSNEITRTDDFRLYLPVYKAGFDVQAASLQERSHAFEGFVGAVLYFSDLARLLTQSSLQDDVDLRMQLVSADESTSHVLLDSRSDLSEKTAPLWRNHPEVIGDHTILMETWAAPAWQPGQSAFMKVVLGFAVLLMLFIASFSIVAAGQAARNEFRITRRTASLKRARKDLESVLNSVATIIIKLRADGSVAHVNRAAKNVFGISEKDFADKVLLSQAWAETISPDYADLMAAVSTALAGESVHQDIRLKCADGSLIIADLVLSPIFDSAGAVDSVILAATDITARTSAEDRLQQNEALLKRVIEGSRMGYWDWDVTSNQVHLGGAWADLLGYAAKDAQASATDWEKLLHPADRVRLMGELQASLTACNGALTCEVRAKSKTGDWYWLLVRGNVISSDGAGRALKVSGTVSDINSRKRIAIDLEKSQHRLKMLNQSLEAQVAQRTAELKALNDELEDRVRQRTQQLETAQYEAEVANRAKSNFLASMSHEIRTPLNGVIGMLDVLMYSDLPDSQVEMLDLIRRSAFSLVDIIDDILDFSKIEAGKLELEQEPVCVTSIVEQACELLDQVSLAKGVEVTLFTSPWLPACCFGDEVRLRQILVNLLSNAIKFSSGQHPGRVAVSATLVESRSASVRIQLEVSDNGIGIDPSAQLKLFSSFDQADVSTTRRYGGTGLGLNIVDSLVGLMGGDISVESEAGKGATFTVQIPFQIAPESAHDMPVAPSGPSLEGLQCLLIGSPAGVLKGLGAYLEFAGAVVARAPEISDAAARSAGFSPETVSLWIYDAGGQSAPIDALRSAAGSAGRVRFLSLERGARRIARSRAADHLVLDANLLKQSTFLAAVACAAGILDAPALPVPGLRSGRKPGPVTPLQHPDERILVAEDNEVNQKVLQRQLALLGYQADFAWDGREALERWRDNGRYSLILTDIHMPEMDGYDLTRNIRALETAPGSVPIIALTANALKGEAERCLATGMNAYLSKPVALAELKTALEHWSGHVEKATLPPQGERLNAARAQTALDLQVLRELVGDDEAFAQELLQEFRALLDTHLVSMRGDWGAGELDAVAAAAHKLKSSSRAMGALALCGILEQFESAVALKDRAALKGLMSAFETEVSSVIACVEQVSGVTG